MSKRAESVARALKAGMMGKATVDAARSALEMRDVDAQSVPVIAVSDGIASGITITIHHAQDSAHDIDALVGIILRIAKTGIPLPDIDMPSVLILSFTRMVPVRHGSTRRVGARLDFVAIEHSTSKETA